MAENEKDYGQTLQGEGHDLIIKDAQGNVTEIVHRDHGEAPQARFMVSGQSRSTFLMEIKDAIRKGILPEQMLESAFVVHDLEDDP